MIGRDSIIIQLVSHWSIDNNLICYSPVPKNKKKKKKEKIVTLTRVWLPISCENNLYKNRRIEETLDGC